MAAKIWTLEDVKDLCIEEGQCWLWKGAARGDGYPYAYINGKRELVRSWVYRTVNQVHGYDPKYGVITKCGIRGCVSPQCLELVTRSRLQKGAKRDKARDSVNRRRAIVEAGRTVLDMEKARDIRASDLSTKELMAKYGVCESTIQKVRRGIYWAEGAANSSVFNWRPAA